MGFIFSIYWAQFKSLFTTQYLKSFQPRPLNNRSFDPVDTVSAISMTRKSLFMGPFKVSSPGPELIFNLTLGSGQKCSKSLKNSTFAMGQIDVGDGYCRQNILVTIARCCWQVSLAIIFQKYHQQKHPLSKKSDFELILPSQGGQNWIRIPWLLVLVHLRTSKRNFWASSLIPEFGFGLGIPKYEPLVSLKLQSLY